MVPFPLFKPLASFVMTDLLEPETGRRRVQHPQKLQMLILRSPLGKFDHRSRLCEDLPTPIQHEVIMSSNFSENDREMCCISVFNPPVPRPPLPIAFTPSLSSKTNSGFDHCSK